MAVTKRMRFVVLERDGFTCRYCKATDQPLEVDHVIPKALGGQDILGNLVASCIDCNRGKAANAVQLDRNALVAKMKSLRPAKREQLNAPITPAPKPEVAEDVKRTKHIRDLSGCIGGGMTLQAAASRVIEKTGDTNGVLEACKYLLERRIAK